MRLLGAVGFACVLGACAGLPAPASIWTIDDLFGPPAEAGAYADFLAARYAGMTDDPEGAAGFYRQAYDRAPDDASALERAAFSTLVAGDVETAASLAAGADPSVLAGAPFAQLALIVDEIADGRDRRALTRLQSARLGAINDDVASGLTAWLMAESNVDAAVARAAPVAGRSRSAGELAYVQGLILSAAGRDADALVKFGEGWRLRVRLPLTVAAHMRLLASLGDPAGAEAIRKAYEDEVGLTPEVSVAAAMLAGGGAVAPVRLSTREGAAASIYAVTAGAVAQTNEELATLYFSLALRLDPDFDLARIHLADALRDQGREPEAIAALQAIGPQSAYADGARVEEAWMLHGTGRDDAALKLADALAADARDRIVRLRTADLYTRLGQDRQAEALYSLVVEGDAAAGRRDWRPLFARAAAREALGLWPGAEADLGHALEIAPERAEVLNFLGYAWVERGTRVADGFALIKRAIAQEPDAGYIVDSLGWAHYRLGQYEDAVEQLERAVELSPSDVEISDHLGDAYWRLGRTIEAGYAWRQALTLKPGPDLEASLRRKISGGLADAGPRVASSEARAPQ